MFVIVHNNSVIWGPKDWNKRGFEEVILEDCEVVCQLPTRNDGAIPITVDNDIVILHVVALENPPLNQKTQRYDGPFWNFYEDRAEMYYTVADLPVDVVKSFLIDNIASNRNKVENGSISITINTNTVSVSADRTARHVYTTTAMTMNDVDTVEWKFPEGWLTLQKTDVMKIITDINKHVSDCFVWENQKIAEINAATTLEELNAIELEYIVQ